MYDNLWYTSVRYLDNNLEAGISLRREVLEAAEHATGGIGNLRCYRTKVGLADILVLVRMSAGSRTSTDDCWAAKFYACLRAAHGIAKAF
jgi:hypothetical protein